MSKVNITSLIFVSIWAFCGCDSSLQPSDPELAEFASQSLPIVHGTLVTGNEHLSTVALSLIKDAKIQGTFCTGTLITPEYVLTAGHCIDDCQGEEESNIEKRPYMYVGIGQSQGAFKEIYAIDSFYVHPQFSCSGSTMQHDIGLIKLKERVPLSVAVPTAPLMPELALSASEIDSSAGIEATSVGFGKTNANDDNSVGVKYKTTRKIYASCPLQGNGSKKCADSTYTSKKGILYLDASQSGTCTGDSGGPTFVVKNGYEYVAGVTSYSFAKCTIVNGMTLVSDYYDFIRQNVEDLPATSGEDCFNKVDDNGDGRIDCDDPYCFSELSCIPEDCFNKVDDNGDGLVDCADSQCSNVFGCEDKSEICDDSIDNDGNGLADCDDPVCVNQSYCQKEICDDTIDNNGDGLIDCQDPQCVLFVACQKENCTNQIDDNGNGLIDCLDSDCANETVCQPEICDDDVDNNGNGLVDCAEASCATAMHCQTEICNDKIDNNSNGLIDCYDSQCASSVYCQPEICFDGIDNNGNGLADCDDPTCGAACDDSEGGCSAMPSSRGRGSWWWLLIAALPLCLRRRKKA